MQNCMKDALVGAGLSVSEVAKSAVPEVYKELKDIKMPMSLEFLSECLMRKNGNSVDGYRIIFEDEDFVKLANSVRRDAFVPFTKQLAGMFYVGEYRKVLDWLVKNRSCVQVTKGLSEAQWCSVVLKYRKTYADFIFAGTGNCSLLDQKYFKEKKRGTFATKSAEGIISVLERFKKSWSFIPLVVDDIVSAVPEDVDGYRKNTYLGYNILNNEEFKKDLSNWFAQGYKIQKDVWYVVCKSKKMGCYLKRDLKKSPKPVKL